MCVYIYMYIYMYNICMYVFKTEKKLNFMRHFITERFEHTTTAFCSAIKP